MKKKKIVILALLGDPTLPAGMPHTGGFNQTLREFLTSLAAFAIPICVITNTSKYNMDSYTQLSKTIDLYRVAISEDEQKNQEKLRNAENRILSEIIGILGGTISDVALIHSFYWISGHLARRINELYQIPYIHTPVSLAYHKIATGSEANCPFQVDCEPTFLQNAAYVMAITEQEAKILSNNYKVQSAQIIVTGRSVDKVFHSPARDSSGNPRGIARIDVPPYEKEDASWWNMGAFTYLGRMVAIKGILQIIHAWISLRRRYGFATPPLWLVGGSPTQIAILRNEIKKQIGDISEHEKQHGIVWWGYLDQASISALFLKTLVLVTHSKFEAGGRVVLEAMCQGKPVIATPNGFAADYIKERYNGFLVPYGNIERLERCMEYFIRQPYLSSSMGNAAKLTFDHIEHSWNYSEVHRKLYECYLTNQALKFDITRAVLQHGTHETIEKVDCFPYFDLSLSTEEWCTELSPFFSSPIKDFHQISLEDAHARHYTGKCGAISYRIKQFYNRLNENAIWNANEKNKVLESMERLRRAELSQNFAGVASMLFCSEQGNYYALPEFEPLNPNYQEQYILLETFCMSTLPKSRGFLDCQNEQMWMIDNGCSLCLSCKTLASEIASLADSSRDLKEGIAHEMLRYLPQIENLLTISHSCVRFGLNYGKPLSHHVVAQNGHPLLLPTADWYWGEIGLDFVDIALHAGEPVHALSWQTNDIRQLLWQVYLAWRNILQAEWQNIVPNSFWTESLNQAMLRLGLTDNVIKP